MAKKKEDKILKKLKERDILYVSKENPTKLKEILKEIDYFFYGIN